MIFTLLALLFAAEAFAAQPGWHRLDPRPGEAADTTIVGFGVEAAVDTVEPALLVCRCRAGELELYVIADSQFVDTGAVHGQRVIEEFIDAAPARTEPWTMSSDHGALFAPDARALGQRLAGAGRLWLGFGKSRGLEFPVRGFAQPWKTLLASCPERTSPRTSPRVAADAKPTDRNPAFGEYVEIDELPEGIRKVSPTYPPEAKAQRQEGTVIVQALVGRDGMVTDTKVVKSVPALDAAAVEAVRHWIFKPAMFKGKPVAVWVAVPVKFSVQ